MAYKVYNLVVGRFIYVLPHIKHKMANMTLSIPEQLHRRIRRHTELKWSDIARQAFESKLKEIEFLEKVLKNSQFTEEDAEIIGHKIKAEIRKRFR